MPQLAGAGAVVLAALVITTRSGPRATARSSPITFLAASVGAGFVVVSAFTTLFAHHLQAAALLAVFALPVRYEWRPRAPAPVLSAVALRVALVGLDGLRTQLRMSSSPDLALRSELAHFVTDARGWEDPGNGGAIRYALVGDNTEAGLVQFLPDRFDRVCRYGFQLPWLGARRFAEHTECIASSPDVVIESNVEPVGPEYVLSDPIYRDFRLAESAILEDAFVLEAEGPVHGRRARVWIRRLQTEAP